MLFHIFGKIIRPAAVQIIAVDLCIFRNPVPVVSPEFCKAAAQIQHLFAPLYLQAFKDLLIPVLLFCGMLQCIPVMLIRFLIQTDVLHHNGYIIPVEFLVFSFQCTMDRSTNLVDLITLLFHLLQLNTKRLFHISRIPRDQVIPDLFQ